MATITKRGTSYLVRWYRLDGTRAARTCPDRRTADELRRDVERTHALGHEWAPEAPSLVPGLDAAGAAFLAHVRRTKRPATHANYESALGRFLDFTGPGQTVEVLSRATIERWYDALGAEPSRRGGPLSEATRQGYVRQVTTWWAWLHDREEYEAHVQRPRAVALPSLDTTPTVAPTWAECDACIRELMRAPAQGSPSVVALRVAVIMRYTGLRAGQAAALRAEDVDLDAALMTVRGETGKSRQERQGRVVPVSPWLVEAVRSWRVEAGPLCGAVTYAASTGRVIRDAWRRTSVRAEAYTHRPEHAFRKALVTELRRLGADGDAVERLVGHSAGIRGVYTDPSALPLRRTVAMIARIDEAPGGAVVPMRAAGRRITVGSQAASAGAKP